MDKRIDKLEKEKIKLAPEQRQAVKEAMTEGVPLLLDNLGTGKQDYNHKFIISLLEEEGYEVILAAPTGRAAKRMSEATGRKQGRYIDF